MNRKIGGIRYPGKNLSNGDLLFSSIYSIDKIVSSAYFLDDILADRSTTVLAPDSGSSDARVTPADNLPQMESQPTVWEPLLYVAN